MQRKFRPGKLFPAQPEIAAHMENLWAQLKAITDDLDQWDPTSQMSPKDFKQLCSRFLTNLVKDLNIEGPENVSMAISAASLGNASSSSPALSSVSRRAELEAMKVPAIRKLATKIGIKQAGLIRKKADLVQAILGEENIADAPVVGERDVVDDSAVHDRERLGFAPTIITPYLHASVAHFWEQRERLYLLGKFIGVPITHKHISCSPGELSNNKYNRVYFQQSSRRLDGLEKEIICTAWRAIINTEDVERRTRVCPICTFTCVRKLWMTRHISTEHPGHLSDLTLQQQ